jgi:penicillin G amidase
MKWFRRLLWIFVFAVLALFLISYFASKYLGRDIETIDVEHGNLYFSAERDQESGAWKIKAPDYDSLWFAFGYLQTWDREFQTELVRLAARGDLSRLLGDAVLENDRLMRFSFRAAEEEFRNASAPLQEASEMFVEGRLAAQKNSELKIPIEYQILGVGRNDLPDWQPEDIVAIARFHSWQLSFDSNLEQVYAIISDKIGEASARLLFPSEPKGTQALYSQEELYRGVEKAALLRQTSSLGRLPQPIAFYPKKSVAQENTMPFLTKPAPFLGDTINFDWGTQLGLRGASNMWVLADPRVNRNLTLCNDTHLRFSWPASLYPVQYELEGVTKGTGFMLPAVPALVIGTVEGQGEKQGEVLSWGITLASYGDTQDLIYLPQAKALQAVTQSESYSVRNLESGQIEVRRHNETWTSRGPRVDTILKKVPLPEDHILVLDWLGYSQAPSPFEFFLKRNIQGREDLLEDLHSRFSYPSFNFTWIEKEKTEQARIGHLVTGWLRSRGDRENTGLKILTEDKISRLRKELQPSERPYFIRNYDGKDPFFLVTANQRIWQEEEWALKLAHSWEPDDRAKRIIEKFKENIREPSFSQTDSFSPALYEFFKRERARNSVNRLCSQDVLKTQQCLELIAEWDSWNGMNEVDSWQTSLTALWHAYFKAEIFMALIPKNSREEMVEMMSDWHRRAFSAQAVAIILRDPQKLESWEALSSKKIQDVSVETFQKALSVLVGQRGENKARWRWGQFHRMDWLHPLVKAPEPWGSVFHDSVLGPRVGVAGAVDSPGRFEYTWSPEDPLNFAATHGASLRMCTELSDDGVKMKWSAPTGPSGNPFSIHSKAWSFRSFFKGLLSEIN